MPVDDQQILRLMDKLDRIAESLGEVRGQLRSSQRSFEELNAKATTTDQTVAALLSDVRMVTRRLDGVDTAVTELKTAVKSIEQEHMLEQGERTNQRQSFTILEKVVAVAVACATLYTLFK